MNNDNNLNDVPKNDVPKNDIADDSKDYAVKDEELYTYIGSNNLDYYYKIFKDNNHTDNFISWNWCSFLFTPFWLLYRKMYIWFIIFLIVEFVFDTFSFMFPGIGWLLKLGLMFVFGLVGNSIYLNSAKHRIRKINKIFSNHKYKKHVLSSTGGTSLIAPLILFAIITIFILTLGITLGSLLSSAVGSLLSQYNIIVS